MSVAPKGIFIVGAKRTAFGSFGGVFKDTSAAELQSTAIMAALQQGGVRPETVDTVNIGQVLQVSSPDGIYLPRHVALKCAIRKETPALGVNRLCGSGLQAVINSAQDIVVGMAKVSLSGGVESMSTAPYCLRNMRFGTKLRNQYSVEDTLMSSWFDSMCGLSMPLTAENLGEQFKVKREQCDEFALKSHKNWKIAQDAGAFEAEITPMEVQVKDKRVTVKVDQSPRHNTTIDQLNTLTATFKKGGLVTAGNACGIGDGAGAIVLASEESCKRDDLQPLARVVGWSVVGVEPRVMGLGPVPAVLNVLAATNHTLDQIDLIEINEAFAAQVLSCVSSLGLDLARINVCGGALAVGHPLGASGARILTHLAHQLKRRGLKRAIASACIGGGQGIAILIEAV